MKGDAMTRVSTAGVCDEAHHNEQSDREYQTTIPDPAEVRNLSAHELGKMGELIAASYLDERGYDILEHSYRCPEGEADLIAYDPVEECVVLVEVKSRRVTDGSVLPEEAVDAKKRKRYRRIAACYIMDRFPVMAIRFDAIAITFMDGELAHLEHIYEAFDWEVDR